MSSFIGAALNEASEVLRSFSSQKSNLDLVEQAIGHFVSSIKSGGKILSCGNGGSLCDAMHFAEELTGRYRKDRPALPALAMADSSHMSCVANDFGYAHVFSRIVDALGRPGDTLLAISTSGNSENVILAVESARKQKMQVVGLLGKNGGKLKSMVDVPIIVDTQTTDRIQEVHIKIIHIFIEGIERKIFPELYATP